MKMKVPGVNEVLFLLRVRETSVCVCVVAELLCIVSIIKKKGRGSMQIGAQL